MKPFLIYFCLVVSMICASTFEQQVANVTIINMNNKHAMYGYNVPLEIATVMRAMGK